MSRSLRLLTTAVLIVALGGATATFIAYHWGALSRQSVFEVATTGDLRDLFGSQTPQGPMLANRALRKLESDF